MGVLSCCCVRMKNTFRSLPGQYLLLPSARNWYNVKRARHSLTCPPTKGHRVNTAKRNEKKPDQSTQKERNTRHRERQYTLRSVCGKARKLVYISTSKHDEQALGEKYPFTHRRPLAAVGTRPRTHTICSCMMFFFHTGGGR